MTSVWHENGHVPPLSNEELAQAALGMLLARRAMRGTLPDALIHDVALEVLLTVHLGGNRAVPVDLLVSKAAVPGRLVVRWIAALVSEGLMSVVGDEASLTSAGAARMKAMLTSVVASKRSILGWERH